MAEQSQPQSLAGRAALPVLMLLVMGQAAALLTHVWATAVRHEWLFLFLGFLAYPVGVTHGVGVWLGVWR